VPTNFEINGDEEELTISVAYETQKLYGNVTTKQKIIIQN